MNSPAQKYSLADLLQLMRALRDPGFGCPWDLQQDLESLIPYTLEEAYEVAETIEQNDVPALRQELGDLLFQVVFYAQIAQEQGDFDFEDVTSEIGSKLLRRHPHVFPDGTLESAGKITQPVDEETIANNWQAIKEQERQEKLRQEKRQQEKHQLPSALDDVPRALPAQLRAEKLQSRAASRNFDWTDADGVMEKLREEMTELESAYHSGSKADMAEELGDLMFTCVNLARWMKISPEQCLRMANNKFEKRFRLMEMLLQRRHQTMSELSENELEALWIEAKESNVES